MRTNLLSDDGLFEPRADHTEGAGTLTGAPGGGAVWSLEVPGVLAFLDAFLEVWDDAGGDDADVVDGGFVG